MLERLRTAFWSDEVSLPTPVVILPPTPQEAPAQTPTPQTQPPTPQSFKRVFSEHDEDLSYQNPMTEPKSIERKRMKLSGKVFSQQKQKKDCYINCMSFLL